MADIVSITTNASALAHALGDVTGKQIPFATALALTDVAFKVQRAEKSEMAKALTLRNKFSQGGVQVNPAQRADWPNMQSEVGIEQRRSYLIGHITSETRKPLKARALAVVLNKQLRGPGGKVVKANRPRAQERKGAFEIQTANGPVQVKRASKGRYPLLPLYAYEPTVKIRREFEFDTIAGKQVAALYHPAFRKAMERAIRTAK